MKYSVSENNENENDTVYYRYYFSEILLNAICFIIQ